MELLSMIVSYFRHNRSAGHSYPIIEAARKDKNILVLFPNLGTARGSGLPKNQIVTLEDLKTGKLMGCRKPMLIDHTVLDALYHDNYLQWQNERIKEARKPK